jgi:hypothetical protein
MAWAVRSVFRRCPTTLYEVVRDDLETLYAAVDQGALPVARPAFVLRSLVSGIREVPMSGV